MFARDNVERFPAISAHKKPVSEEWQCEIEAHIEKYGFTDMDAEGAPKRKVPRTDIELRKLQGVERKKAEAKAQKEHQEAQARLADGTAVLRQKRERPIAVKKAAKKVPKAVKSTEPKRKPHTRQHTKANFDAVSAQKRRSNIMQKLLNGERIKYVAQKDCEDGYQQYQQQYTDIRWLKRVKGLDIARIQCVQTMQAYFALNKFTAYEQHTQISGYIFDAKEKSLLASALMSNKLVLASDLESTTKVGARSVATIAEQLGLDIYTVFDGRVTKGWVCIDTPIDPKELARLQEISKLVDALDALKYLEMKKKLHAYRFPMNVPDVILDAAFREFKRVEKCGQ